LSWSRSQKGGKKEQEDETWLVVEPTHLKNMLVKLETFPNFRGEKKQYLKPPPTNSREFSVLDVAKT